MIASSEACAWLTGVSVRRIDGRHLLAAGGGVVAFDPFAEGPFGDWADVDEFDANAALTVDQGVVAHLAAQDEAVCAIGLGQFDDNGTQGRVRVVDEDQARSVHRQVDDLTAEPRIRVRGAVSGRPRNT